MLINIPINSEKVLTERICVKCSKPFHYHFKDTMKHCSRCRRKHLFFSGGKWHDRKEFLKNKPIK